MREKVDKIEQNIQKKKKAYFTMGSSSTSRLVVCSIQREGIIFCVIEGKKGVCVCYESNLRWLGRFLASLVGVKRTRKGCSIRHVLLG